MGDRVKFVVKRTTVSTKPVEPGKSYRLSVLDHVMEPNHIRLVYYYQCPKGRKAGETINKLRESLAHTLTYFPIMTGRLVKNDGGDGDSVDSRRWRVKCNDAGVRVVEAKTEGTMEEWLRSVDWEDELKLVHWEEMFHIPYYWSTFYVKMTEFEDGGLAIGLSCTHLLADPICATMFMRAWADITLAQTMSAPPLFHPLLTRRPSNTNPAPKPHHTRLMDHYSKSSTPVDAVNRMTTVALLFHEPTIRAYTSPGQHNNGSYGPAVSPFEVLAGLFWACVSKAKGAGDGLMDMSIGLDMRKVLHLDQGYFGNCMIYSMVEHQSHHKPPYSVTAEDKSSHIIDAIRRTIQRMDYDEVVDLIEWLRSEDRTHPLTDGSDLVCINLENIADPNLTVFEEEFRPSRVSCYVESTSGGGRRRVIVLPAPPGEGPTSRTVMITLPAAEMNQVMEDVLLRSFSPVVLMGTKTTS